MLNSGALQPYPSPNPEPVGEVHFAPTRPEGYANREVPERTFTVRSVVGALRRAVGSVRGRGTRSSPSVQTETDSTIDAANYAEDTSHLATPVLLGAHSYDGGGTGSESNDEEGAEVIEPDGVNALIQDLLNPANLEATKAQLLDKENSSDAVERAIARYHYGFMEARPDSLIVRSSDEVGRRVSDAVIAAPQLKDRLFVPKSQLLSAAKDSGVVVIDKIAQDPNITLPLDSFVYAEGFLSWERGRGDVKKVEDSVAATTRTSAQTIAAYSGRTTQAPPLESVTGYVQPNGIVLYATEQGSHRTGAAVARGDATIEAKKLTLVSLKENIVT